MVSTVLPSASGTAQVGQKPVAHHGTWSTVTFTYQWYANNVAITGATAYAVTLTPAQLAKKITVAVTGSETGFDSASETSAATAAVAKGVLSPTPTPTISGTLKVGSKR